MNILNKYLILLSMGTTTLFHCESTLAVDSSANITLTSDYVFRGFSQTEGDPAIQGGFDVAHETGLYAGIWASNVESNPAAPINYNGANLEADLYVGWATTIESLSVNSGWLRYQYPGTDTDANNTDEFHIGAGYDFGVIASSVTLNYSPDYFGADKAFYWDIGVDVPLPKDFFLTTHYGITDYNDNTLGDDYNDWRVGMSMQQDGFEFDLSYIDTTGVNGNCLKDTCDGRVVLSATKSL